MTPDETRALIADGRRHDEAMTSGPWRECCSDQDESHPCRLILGAGDGEVVGSLELDVRRPPKADLAGIAWMRTNLATMLTGYAEALAEVERLSSTAWAAVADDLRRENERLRAELLQWKSPCVSVGSAPSDWVCPTCKDPKCGDA